MAVQFNVIEEFREDHRKVRDLILELAGTLRQRDVARARTKSCSRGESMSGIVLRWQDGPEDRKRDTESAGRRMEAGSYAVHKRWQS